MNFDKQKETQDDTRSKQIMSAQLRKQMSISWFHANNNAITLAIAQAQMMLSNHSTTKTQYFEIEDSIRTWRDKFLNEYAEYHQSNIDKVTPENIDIHEAIKQILSCTTTAEVRRYASSLPDQTRNDEQFIQSARAHLAKLKATERAQATARALEADSDLPTISIDEPLPVKKSKK